MKNCTKLRTQVKTDIAYMDYKINRNKYILIGLLLFTILGSLINSKAFAQKNQLSSDVSDITAPYRVLCILSYNYSYNIVADETLGIVAGLASEDYDIDFDITYESMDAKNFYTSEDIAMFTDYISYKLSETEEGYDLVIAADDTALRFVMNNRDTLFNDIPIVFLGINSLSEALTANALDDVTGVAEVPNFEDNYELMKKLFPQRNRIVAIVDSTNTGQGEFVQFMQFISNHPDQQYAVLNTSRYSKEGVKKYLQELGDEDIILYLDFVEDGNGNIYTLSSATKFISKYAPNVPIFRTSSADIGNGVLGGISYSFYEAGKMAGEMGVRILCGEDPDAIPMVSETVSTPMFEQEIMTQYGIKKSEIPEDSVIINENYTFVTWYMENFVIANLVIVICILLIVIIIMLARSNKKREKLVNSDNLTEIPNRLYINKQINTYASNKENYGLLMVDIDYFKNINDSKGHLAGDEVLCTIAERLSIVSNNNDSIAARIGGDEFLILVKNASRDKCNRIFNQVMSIMRDPVHTSKGDVNVTLSMGGAVYPDNTDDPYKVMSLADKALYKVKEAGRNGYQMYQV